MCEYALREMTQPGVDANKAILDDMVNSNIQHGHQ